jgi:uncharacterized damage-inducible protein DinB
MGEPGGGVCNRPKVCLTSPKNQMIMALKDSLLIELEKETHNTRRILKRLADTHWDYKPHPKSTSLGELASHIVDLHNWVADALSKDVFDFKVDYVPPATTTVAALQTALDEGYERNRQSIEASADADWAREWTLKAGDWVIAQMPRAGAIRFIVNSHLIHHRGQLTVYLRMLDIPVPGLYGPSADEKQG